MNFIFAGATVWPTL